MLTLEQLNLSEEDLNFYLKFIYEAEDHPEKEHYHKFIDEATMDQKLGLLNILVSEIKDPEKQGHLRKAFMSRVGQVAGLGVFWAAYRGIRAAVDKCSRKCSVAAANTFMRQKCMAECKVGEMNSAIGAANKIQCGPKDPGCPEKKKEMIAKYQQKLTDAKNKHQRYVEKHKKLRYTV